MPVNNRTAFTSDNWRRQDTVHTPAPAARTQESSSTGQLRSDGQSVQATNLLAEFSALKIVAGKSKLPTLESKAFPGQSFVCASDWIKEQEIGASLPESMFKGEIIEVSEATMDRMLVLYTELFRTKAMLKYGSADAPLDLLGTEGESWARLKLNKTRYQKLEQTDYQKIVDRSKLICWTEAGNCGEHAYLSFYNAAMNAALADLWLFVVKDAADHAYVIAAELPNMDPKEAPTISAEGLKKILDPNSTIVMDAWVFVPFMHLKRDNISQIDEILVARAPHVRMPDPSPDAKQGTCTQTELNKLLQQRGVDRPGRQLILKATQDPLNPRPARGRILCVSSLKNSYKSPSGRIFEGDILPKEYVDMKTPIIAKAKVHQKK